MVTSAPRPSVSCGDGFGRILAPVVDDHVGAEPLGRVQAAVGEVDGDDVRRAVEAGAHDGRQADGAGAHHGDDVAGLDVTVQHADLVARSGGCRRASATPRRRPRQGRGRSSCRRTAPGRTRPGCRRSCGRGSTRRRPGTARSGLRGRTGTCRRSTRTRPAPGRRCWTRFTPRPTCSTVPTASWPRMRPAVTAGTSPLRMCRSVPQIVVASTRTMASVSATSSGLGTSSHDERPGPW